jgi:hypothetical protein
VVVYERHSYLLNFAPFGAGQFQNGQRRKAWIFAGSEAALGAISVGAFAVNLKLFGLRPHRNCLVAQDVDAGGLPRPCPPDQIDHSDEDLSRNLLRLQLVSGGLFFAVAIWGAIDAVMHYQERELLEGDAVPSSAAAAPKAQASRLRFAPGIPDAPLGLGLSGTF